MVEDSHIITYLEPPASVEEMEVAELLESALAAINKKRADKLLSVFAEDAKILPPFSSNNVHLNKEEYAHRLLRMQIPAGRFWLRNVVIRISDNGSEASISGVLHASFSNSQFLHEQKIWRYYKCVKTDAGWRIVETSNL